jgi:acetyltransferase-like isoleucine patch superfamily enzyme
MRGFDDLVMVARQARAVVARWRVVGDVTRRFPSAKIDPSVMIVNPHALLLDDGVVVQQGAVLHCGGRAWSAGGGSIQIGKNTVISPHCVLYGAGGITIGKNFDMGPGSMIFSSRSTYEPELKAGGQHHVFGQVVIGDDVIVYAGCIIGPNVKIGDGSVIGAGSVVLSDVPPSSLYAGSPARLLRSLA